MIRTVKDYEKLSEQYNKMLEERNSLIDDLSWYKAKVSRLEREKEIFHRKLMAQLKVNTNLRMSNKDKHNLLSEISQHIGNKPASSTYKYFRAKFSRLERELKDFDNDYEMVTNNCIYWEDKAHWLEDESSKYINLLSEISQHIGNKPSSSTYKYFRGKLNALEIREGD